MIGRATRIVGLGGSMAPVSTSLIALRIALEGPELTDAETQLFDIATLDLPMYAPGTSDIPESALRLGDAIYESDGLIWSSPMYHGTVSGSFKNALDWMQILSTREPPYLTNKVVGLISTSGGRAGPPGCQHYGGCCLRLTRMGCADGDTNTSCLGGVR